MAINNIMKELRENAGLTMEKTAKSLGIPKGTYASYEYGQREPNIEMINKIADFYQVTSDYLLGRDPIPNLLKIPKKPLDDDEFVKLFETLPDFAQQFFAQLVEELAKKKPEQPKKQRHADKLGDLYDQREQEEQAQEKGGTLSA